MSLINHIEIIEQDERKLQPYLITELNNSANWRENKSDDLKDQCNYFQSYFEKGLNSNMHIDKEVLTAFLRESEKYTKTHPHIPQTNFLELITNDEHANILDLIFYDATTYQLKVISIINNNENSHDANLIEIEDLNESTVLTDTKAIDMKVNHQYSNRINIIDMYSIYDISINNNSNSNETNNDSKVISYTKQLTLPEIPNCYLSNMPIDSFFVISQGNSDNWLHLISDSYQIITRKQLNENNRDMHYLKGEYLGIPEHIAIYNKQSIKLCDFRSNASTESILFSNDSFNINELKYINHFNYITFSPQKLSLFDLRYPSLPISEMPLHINYSQFKMKEVIKSEEHCYLSPIHSCIDNSKRDQSHLLFDINEKIEGILRTFCKYDLIKNDKLQIDIHDSINYLCANGVYLNFIVDNLCGVYLNVYDLTKNINGKDDMSSFNQVLFKDETCNDDIKNKTLNDDIVNLFKKIFVNQVYCKQKENVLFKKEGKDDDSSKDDDNDDMEEEENGINFGTVMINDSKKKMYRIENKRFLLEEILAEKKENRKGKNNNIEIKDISNSDSAIKESALNETDMNKLQYLKDEFKISNQSSSNFK